MPSVPARNVIGNVYKDTIHNSETSNYIGISRQIEKYLSGCTTLQGV
jgi:hypothetical protein